MALFDDAFEEIDDPAPMPSFSKPAEPVQAAKPSPFASWVNADSKTGGHVSVGQRLPAFTTSSSLPSRVSPVHQSWRDAGTSSGHTSSFNGIKRLRMDQLANARSSNSPPILQDLPDLSAFLPENMTATSAGPSRSANVASSDSVSRAMSNAAITNAYGQFRQQASSAMVGGGRGGIPVVSGHAAKASQSRPPKAVIDLRSSDEDDEVQVVGSTGPKPQSKPNTPTRAPDVVIDDSPVCIGQINSLALIMYPVPSVSGTTVTTVNGPVATPAPSGALPVRLARSQPLGPNETIRVCTYSNPPESFAVVEHRVANALGQFFVPKNGRKQVLSCTAAVVRKGEMNPMILPLHLLLFCRPAFVQLVARSLEASAIFLEHPQSYDPKLHGGAKYSNPHDSSGVRTNEAERRRRELLSGMGTGGFSYASRGVPQAKKVDLERQQVEQVFKSLRSGVDMEEREPPDIVRTSLYRHQKQAVTFLLHREEQKEVKAPDCNKAVSTANPKEADTDDDDMISLWRLKNDIYGRKQAWVNVVTNIEVASKLPPPQCRGAILADDMGLGKTIVMISLIASTLGEARDFSKQEPIRIRDTTSHFDAVLNHPGASKPAAAGFSVQPWSQSAAKQKKKEDSKTTHKRQDAEAAQRARLVTRSRATLIICPLSTIQNWESQIEEHTGGKSSSKGKEKADTTLTVYVYHGQNRTNDPMELIHYDVVLTTFATLGSEYSRLVKMESRAGDEAKLAALEGGGEESELEEVDASGIPLKFKMNGHLQPPTPAISSTEPNTPNASADESKSKKRKRTKAHAAPLQLVEWFRIVLDEAHMIKEHSTIQAKAACELAGERRTCLTGTPLQNQLDDIYSLIRFLRLDPFTDRAIWNTFIGSPAKLGDKLGVTRLQLVMRHLALRRTKDSKDAQGKPILDLPRRSDEMIYLKLSEAEQAYYNSHHVRYKHNLEKLQATDTVMKNYCSILQELLRLRQICVHPDLVRESEDAKSSEEGDIVGAIKQHGISTARALQLFALLRDNGSAQCGECGAELGPAEEGDAREEEEADDRPAGKRRKNARAANGQEGPPPSGERRRILTRCTHLFCGGCFDKICPSFRAGAQVSDRMACPACREEISPVIDAVAINLSDFEKLSLVDAIEAVPDKKKGSSVHSEPSTKIRALLVDLLPFSQANPSSANYAPMEDVFSDVKEEDDAYRPHKGEVVKSVVFSQWVKLLDKIGHCLSQCNIHFARLDGTMSRIDRSRAMQAFKEDPSCEILLVSLRAGGVGLNLTAAQRVYLMEPFWNPAVEAQALDRVHRLGQTKPVKTKRYIIEDSIEANMLKVQKRKQDLANLSMSVTLTKAQLQEQRKQDLMTLME